MKSLNTTWSAGQWPTLNGLTFADGRYFAIRPIDAPREPLPMRLSYTGPRQIESFQEAPLTSLVRNCETSDDAAGLTAAAGECSAGEDGFVACLESTGVLRWVAFFDFSNPFERVQFDGANLVAENNLGEAWRFPLATPWEVTVVLANPSSCSQRSQ